MAQYSGSPRAFTLIEVLVSITVVAVLLSLVLPSLAGARRRADSVQCLSALAQLHLFVTVFAEGHNKGLWPNALDPQTEYGHWVLGDTETTTVWTLDQTPGWVGPLAAKGYVTRNAGEIVPYSCRAAIRKVPSDDLRHNPQLYAEASYFYSAALYTAAELWDPAVPARRAKPDDFRRSVGLHEVAFPAAKVAYFETGDHHGSGKWLAEFSKPGAGHLNVLCCDGHTATVDPFMQEPALAAPWNTYHGPGYWYVPLPAALPFSSAAEGFRGRDLR